MGLKFLWGVNPPAVSPPIQFLQKEAFDVFVKFNVERLNVNYCFSSPLNAGAQSEFCDEKYVIADDEIIETPQNLLNEER